MYIVHHFNDTQLSCAPLTCVLHYQPSVLHQSAPYFSRSSQRTYSQQTMVTWNVSNQSSTYLMPITLVGWGITQNLNQAIQWLYWYYVLRVCISNYPMIKKSSQSEATVSVNCDPIYLLHGAILNLAVGIWPPFWKWLPYTHCKIQNGRHIPTVDSKWSPYTYSQKKCIERARPGCRNHRKLLLQQTGW